MAMIFSRRGRPRKIEEPDTEEPEASAAAPEETPVSHENELVDCTNCPVGKKTGKPSGLVDGGLHYCPVCHGTGSVEK